MSLAYANSHSGSELYARACAYAQQFETQQEKDEYISRFSEEAYIYQKAYTVVASTSISYVMADPFALVSGSTRTLNYSLNDFQKNKDLKLSLDKLPPYEAEFDTKYGDCIHKIHAEVNTKQSLDKKYLDNRRKIHAKNSAIRCEEYQKDGSLSGCNTQPPSANADFSALAMSLGDKIASYPSDRIYCECSPSAKTPILISPAEKKEQKKRIADVYKQELIKSELMKIVSQIEMSDFIAKSWKEGMEGDFEQQGCSSKESIEKQIMQFCGAKNKNFDTALLASVYSDLLGRAIDPVAKSLRDGSDEIYKRITYKKSMQCSKLTRSSYYAQLAKETMTGSQFKAFDELIRELFSDKEAAAKILSKHKSEDTSENWKKILIDLSVDKNNKLKDIFKKHGLEDFTVGSFNMGLPIKYISDYVSSNPIYKMMLGNPELILDYVHKGSSNSIMQYGFLQSANIAQKQCDNAVTRISEIACGDDIDIDKYQPSLRYLSKKLPDINLGPLMCEKVNQGGLSPLTMNQMDYYSKPDFADNFESSYTGNKQELTAFENFAKNNCPFADVVNDQAQQLRSGGTLSGSGVNLSSIYGDVTKPIPAGESVLGGRLASSNFNTNQDNPITSDSTIGSTEKIDYNLTSYVRSVGSLGDENSNNLDNTNLSTNLNTPLSAPANAILDNYRKVADKVSQSPIEPNSLTSDQKQIFSKLAQDESIANSDNNTSINEYSQKIADLERMLQQKESELNDLNLNPANSAQGQNLKGRNATHHGSSSNSGLTIGSSSGGDIGMRPNDISQNNQIVANNVLEEGAEKLDQVSARGNPFSVMTRPQGETQGTSTNNKIALTMEKISVVDINNEEVLKQVSEHIKELISTNFESIMANYADGKVKLTINGEEVQVELSKVLDRDSLAQLESRLKTSRSIASAPVKQQLEQDIMNIRQAMYKNLVLMSKQLRSSGILH